MHPHARTFGGGGGGSLIDYGQVKRLTLNERLYLAKMVTALRHGDRARLRDLAVQGGFRSKHLDPDVIWNMSVFALDRDGRDVTGGLNIQQFMDEQFAKDPWEAVNSAIIMPSRVSVLLRGLGLMLNCPVSVLSAWGPAAEALLARHNLSYKDDMELPEPPEPPAALLDAAATPAKNN